jgi:hypothetical protein
MSVGFTAPRPTEEQREAKRIAKLKKVYGACRSGHIRTPDNVHWWESVPYCAACVEAGTVRFTTLRWVYFIADGAGHVKIGYTVDVASRLNSLQTSTAFELRVLAVLKGGAETERQLHERFAEHRVRGEWFRLVPEILDYVAGIPKPEPKPVAPLPPPPVEPPTKPKPVPEYVRIQQELIRKQAAS